MECWRSNTEDEAIFESTVLAEVCMIHSWAYNKPLNKKTTLILVSCTTQTLFELTKFYAIKVSGNITREKQIFKYENNKLTIGSKHFFN
jgi:hypothetical protein